MQSAHQVQLEMLTHREASGFHLYIKGRNIGKGGSSWQFFIVRPYRQTTSTSHSKCLFPSICSSIGCTRRFSRWFSSHFKRMGSTQVALPNRIRLLRQRIHLQRIQRRRMAHRIILQLAHLPPSSRLIRPSRRLLSQRLIRPSPLPLTPSTRRHMAPAMIRRTCLR